MKNKMAEAVRGFHLPRYSQLPTDGLYLEQTTQYINSFLAPLSGVEITSTMISNYVKKGLLPNPVKKQYGAEHIAYLFFIIIAKNLISMEHIRLLIDMQKNTYTLPVAYDYLCNEFENMLLFMFGVKDSIEDIGETASDEKNLLCSLIYSAVNVIYMHAYFQLHMEYEQ